MKKNQQRASSTYNRSSRPGAIETLPILPDTGKVPPHSKELEEAVLAAIMIEKGAIDRVNLRSDDFYHPQNQIIFTIIERLRDEKKPIDLLTVVEELNKASSLDKAGEQCISRRFQTVASAAHVEHHAAIIKQKAVAGR